MLTRDKQSEVKVTSYSSQFSIITNRTLASPEKGTKGNSRSPTVRQLDFDFRVNHMNKMNLPISCYVLRRHCVLYFIYGLATTTMVKIRLELMELPRRVDSQLRRKTLHFLTS